MIWLLLVIFQLKHFIADYLLQTAYMLGKFKEQGWVKPLAAHCGVHFVFTFLITFFAIYHRYSNHLDVLLTFSFLVGVLDFSIHFVMDRVKASPKLLGRYQALSKAEMSHYLKTVKMYENTSNNTHPEIQIFITNYKRDFLPKLRSNVLFWWSLGLDQMVHHLTDILIIALIMGML